MAKEKPTTKICKYCKTEIPYDAKVCPQCRKKQGGGLLKKILIALVIIIILSAIFGGEDDDNVKTGTADIVAPENDEKELNNTDSTNETNEENNGATRDSIGVGEYFELDGLKVTVNECDLEYTEYEDEYGLYELEDGLKYIRVSFTYENSNDSDKYVSIYDYDCYADGTLCEQSYNFGGDFMNANLSNGRNVSFETFYVIPSDAQEIELEYTESIWTDDKVIIKLQ